MEEIRVLKHIYSLAFVLLEPHLVWLQHALSLLFRKSHVYGLVIASQVNTVYTTHPTILVLYQLVHKQW